MGIFVMMGHYIRFNNEILIDEQFDNGMVQKQLDVYAKYNGRSMFNGRGVHGAVSR